MSDTVSERTTSEQTEAEDQKITARQKKANWRGHSSQATSGLSAQAKKEQNYELIKKEGVLVTPSCSRCDTPGKKDKGVQCIKAVGLSSRCAECYKHNYTCDKKDWVPPPGQPRAVQVAAQALAQLAQGAPNAPTPQPGINEGTVKEMRGATAQNGDRLSPEDILSPRMGRLTVDQQRTPLPYGSPSSMGQLNVNQQRTPLPSGTLSRDGGPPGLQQVRRAQSGTRSPQNLGVGLRPYNGPMSGGPPQFTPQVQGQYNTPTRQGPSQPIPNTAGTPSEAMAPPNRQIAALSSQVQQGSPFSNGYKGGMNVLTSGFTPGGPNQEVSAPQNGGTNSGEPNNGFQQARPSQQGSAPPKNGLPPIGTFTTPSQSGLQPARPNQHGPVPQNGGMNSGAPNNGSQPPRPDQGLQCPNQQALTPQHSGSNFHLRRSASQQFNLLSYSAFPEQNRVVEINNPGQYPAFEVVVDGVRHYAAILTPVRGDSPMIGHRQLPGQRGEMGEQMNGQHMQNGQRESHGPRMKNVQQGQNGFSGQRGPQGPQMQNGMQKGQQSHQQQGQRGPQGPQFNGDRQMKM